MESQKQNNPNQQKKKKKSAVKETKGTVFYPKIKTKLNSKWERTQLVF